MNCLKTLSRFKSLLKYPQKNQHITAIVCNVNQMRNQSKSSNDKSASTLGDIGSKYKPFKEDESEIILDVYEEKLKYSEELLELDSDDERKDIFKGINLERGIAGVFDLEDLVDLLKRENAVDLFVAHVSPEHNYVDYIVVVTGKSKRHMRAIAEFVRRVYKQKRNQSDAIPKIEGENSNDWIAMDLGNIALHVFSHDARTYYDLDSLWAVGPEYDKEFNKQDEIVDMLEKHSMYFRELQPAT